MENSTTCPVCHTAVRPTDFFCFNCGKNLKPKPLTLDKQILLFLGSLFLPPLGIIWGARFLKESDQKSKITGIIAIILTFISLVVTTILLVNTINAVNKELNRQLQQSLY